MLRRARDRSNVTSEARHPLANAVRYASAQSLGDAWPRAENPRKAGSSAGGSARNSTRSSPQNPSCTFHASLIESGFWFITAAVVSRRGRPICVIRQNAIGPAFERHQFSAALRCVCSSLDSASHTFTSGKAKLIDFFVRYGNRFSCAADQAMFQTEPALPRQWRRNGLLDRGHDELARRATFPRGFLAQSSVQITRKIDAGPNSFGFHPSSYFEQNDLNKSKTYPIRENQAHRSLRS